MHEAIVMAVQAGRQPWHTHAAARPVTALGRPYPGAASVLLWLQGRPSAVWLSSAMADRLGCAIRSSEAPTAIPGGEVYNAAQVDGLKLQPHRAPPSPTALIAATGARVMASERPCYNTAFDFIGAPHGASFPVIAHELVRWTACRMGRDLPLVTERLVCDVGAALLCVGMGMKPVPRYDASAFIPVWAKRIAQKPAVFIEAADAAGRASDYLLAFISVEQAECVMIQSANAKGLRQSFNGLY